METDPTHSLDRPAEVEGELSDNVKDSVTAEMDQVFSEEQTYRETFRGIRLYVGWSHIPDFINSHS